MTFNYAKLANSPVSVRVSRINAETTRKIEQRIKFNPLPRLVKKA